MARSTFASRLGYVRWLWHLATGEPLDFSEIGRRVGNAAGTEPLVGQTISGWAKRETAPDSYRNNKALAVTFGVSESWLINGAGEPPRPDLWSPWERFRAIELPDEWVLGEVVADRAANGTSPRIPMRPHGQIIAGGSSEEKEKPAKRAVGGRRKRRDGGDSA